MVSGKVDGWFDTWTTLNAYMIDNCETDNLHLDTTLRFGRYGYVLAFHVDNAQLMHNLSSAIWFLERTEVKQEIAAEYFHVGKTCDNAVQGDDEGETTPVTFEMMRGLFFVYIGFAVAAILIAFLQKYCAGNKDLQDVVAEAGVRAHPQLGHAATEGEMLRYMIGILDRMDGGNGVGNTGNNVGGMTLTQPNSNTGARMTVL